jgi:hypothetical protein
MTLSRITLSPRRVGLLLAAALLAAALLSATVARPAAAGTPSRYITNDSGSHFSILDDEPWPYSDVTGTFTLTDLDGLLVNAANPVATNQTTRCVGDEVRVRLETRAELSTVYKDWVFVTVNARLYEGTSCNTTDLDGTNTMSFWVGPWDSVTHSMAVENQDEGGDRAHIRFNMTNRWALQI